MDVAKIVYIVIQTFNDKNYFLQYHRSREFVESQFFIEREPQKNEINALFVRGATPPNGMISKVGMYYYSNSREDLPIDENGSFDYHWNFILTELMVQKRDLQIITTEKLSNEIAEFVNEHDRKSQLFKPLVSVITEDLFFKDAQERGKLNAEAEKRGEYPQIIVETISDGRKAYLKRVD